MISRSLAFHRLPCFLLVILTVAVLMPQASAQHTLPNHLSKRVRR